MPTGGPRLDPHSGRATAVSSAWPEPASASALPGLASSGSCQTRTCPRSEEVCPPGSGLSSAASGEPPKDGRTWLATRPEHPRRLPVQKGKRLIFLLKFILPLTICQLSCI